MKVRDMSLSKIRRKEKKVNNNSRKRQKEEKQVCEDEVESLQWYCRQVTADESDVLSPRNEDHGSPAEMQFEVHGFTGERGDPILAFSVKIFQPQIQDDGIYLELEIMKKG